MLLFTVRVKNREGKTHTRFEREGDASQTGRRAAKQTRSLVPTWLRPRQPYDSVHSFPNSRSLFIVCFGTYARLPRPFILPNPPAVICESVVPFGLLEERTVVHLSVLLLPLVFLRSRREPNLQRSSASPERLYRYSHRLPLALQPGK